MKHTQEKNNEQKFAAIVHARDPPTGDISRLLLSVNLYRPYGDGSYDSNSCITIDTDTKRDKFKLILGNLSEYTHRHVRAYSSKPIGLFKKVKQTESEVGRNWTAFSLTKTHIDKIKEIYNCGRDFEKVRTLSGQKNETLVEKLPLLGETSSMGSWSGNMGDGTDFNGCRGQVLFSGLNAKYWARTVEELKKEKRWHSIKEFINSYLVMRARPYFDVDGLRFEERFFATNQVEPLTIAISTIDGKVGRSKSECEYWCGHDRNELEYRDIPALLYAYELVESGMIRQIPAHKAVISNLQDIAFGK